MAQQTSNQSDTSSALATVECAEAAKPAPGEPRPVNIHIDNPPFTAEEPSTLAAKAATQRPSPWIERRSDAAGRWAQRDDVEELQQVVAALSESILLLRDENRSTAIRLAEANAQIATTNDRLARTEALLSHVDGVITDAVVGLADSISRQRSTMERNLESLSGDFSKQLGDHASMHADAIASAAEALRAEYADAIAETAERIRASIRETIESATFEPSHASSQENIEASDAAGEAEMDDPDSGTSEAP